MNARILYITAIALFVVAGCKKVYNPEVISSPNSYLVVEGIVNSGADSTSIKLSRTSPLSSKTIKPETNAIVRVEGDDDSTYPLTENDNGVYASAGLNLNASKKYRLRVTTADKEVYLSDFEQVKITPPIDSVGYTIKSNGLQIYSNAHDASNNTRYYRYEYEEAWKFNTAYRTGWEPGPAYPIMIPRAIDIYYCYANYNSSNIILGSTIKLSQDILYQNPIILIPSDAEKIGTRYTILLKQYALTDKAYSFWEQIKKNTENLGSIFDPQPSESSGNIKCITNPAKTVIGYISIGTVQKKRIYVNRSELPPQWQVNFGGCFISTLKFEYGAAEVLWFKPPALNPLDSAFNAGGGFIGWTGATSQCTDCTTRGRLQKPAFWKDK